MADARDLKSRARNRACGFDPRLGYCCNAMHQGAMNGKKPHILRRLWGFSRLHWLARLRPFWCKWAQTAASSMQDGWHHNRHLFQIFGTTVGTISSMQNKTCSGEQMTRFRGSPTGVIPLFFPPSFWAYFHQSSTRPHLEGFKALFDGEGSTVGRVDLEQAHVDSIAN